jgi:signal transduction histidine kinase
VTIEGSVGFDVATRRRVRQLDPAQLARRWVRAALAILLAVVVVLVVAAGFAAHRLYTQADHRYLDQAAPVFAAAQDVLVQMLNQQTAVRGYLITGDPATLAPYRTGRVREARDLAALEANAGADPGIPEQLAAVRREVRALDAFFAREIALVRSGRDGQRRAQQLMASGKAHMDHFRELAQALEVDAGHVVARAKREQHGTFVKTLVFLVGAGIVAVAITVGLLLLVPPRLFRLYRGEQAAREAAEQGADAARALTHVRESVVLLDDADGVRYWNPSAGELFGLRPGATRVPGLAELVVAGRENAGPVPAVLQDRERWLTVAESRFEGGSVVVLRDVSADRELERVRSEFVATAAHELRTPLAAVYGAVRTLRRSDRELPAEAHDQFLGMIESEAERLRLIVDQLLASAQLDRGQIQLDRDAVDVAEVCADAIASAALRKPEAIDLAFEGAPQPVRVRADRARLRQVVANLLENAIKYSPDGGRVELRTATRGNAGVIEVADEGLGIPRDERERIFEKFYRLDPGMTMGVGGSGLGLYISRELTEQMGGTLTVDSRLGHGSTFRISLSLAH